MAIPYRSAKVLEPQLTLDAADDGIDCLVRIDFVITPIVLREGDTLQEHQKDSN